MRTDHVTCRPSLDKLLIKVLLPSVGRAINPGTGLVRTCIICCGHYIILYQATQAMTATNDYIISRATTAPGLFPDVDYKVTPEDEEKASHQDIRKELHDSFMLHPIWLNTAHRPRLAYRVFTLVTTSDPTMYSAICAAFHEMRISTGLNYCGRVHNNFLCCICQSIDHPYQLCPFPGIPGWMGPTPETIAASEKAAQDAVNTARNRLWRWCNLRGASHGRGCGF
ncbi:hypothetical protein B0H14DRAFT_2603101 [Mycena olivaceomarginata]|nr:hypothetical protein B0H14DRAFT_2603101 [Mycena olivaceomarginata]